MQEQSSASSPSSNYDNFDPDHRTKYTHRDVKHSACVMKHLHTKSSRVLADLKGFNSICAILA